MTRGITGDIRITEAGHAAMAKAARVDKRRLCAWGRPPDAIEITPAGLDAVRDYKLAHATAQGAGQVPGAASLSTAAAPDSPARGDFSR